MASLCKQYTYRAHFSHAQLHGLVGAHSRTVTPRARMAQVTMRIVCASPKNTRTSSRNVVHHATFDDTKHGHFSRTCLEPFLQRTQTPLYLQEREASAERSQVYHSERENFMSSSSQDPTSTGKLVALFSSQNSVNQETFSVREDFPLRHQQVFWINEPFFRFSNPVNVAKSLLDGDRDHLLAEARSELMRQEYKVESLNACISELQQQTHGQRLELEDAHFGYAESRREQVRQQEELVLKKKALRGTQI